jgi:hypothetical protein
MVKPTLHKNDDGAAPALTVNQTRDLMLSVNSDVDDVLVMVNALIAIEGMCDDADFARSGSPRTESMVASVQQICGNTKCVKVDPPDRGIRQSMLLQIQAKLRLMKDCSELIYGQVKFGSVKMTQSTGA